MLKELIIIFKKKIKIFILINFFKKRGTLNNYLKQIKLYIIFYTTLFKTSKS